MTDSIHKAPGQYANILKKCFINVPFSRFDHYLEMILELSIQPEIGLDGEVLYTTPISEFQKVSALLEKNGLPCTLHAPFNDLSPGATDSRILQTSREKLHKAFDLIPVFKPRSVVCHLNYEAHKHQENIEKWFHSSLETWKALLQKAEKYDTPVMFENTYEITPEQHIKMLKALDSPCAGFCFDIGHVQAFARNTWQEWFPTMDKWLGQVHLHDNKGHHDDHIAIGQGSIDFSGFFEYLKNKGLTPIITLEPHTEEALWGSLQGLELFDFFSE